MGLCSPRLLSRTATLWPATATSTHNGVSILHRLLRFHSTRLTSFHSRARTQGAIPNTSITTAPVNHHCHGPSHAHSSTPAPNASTPTPTSGWIGFRGSGTGGGCNPGHAPHAGPTTVMIAAITNRTTASTTATIRPVGCVISPLPAKNARPKAINSA